MKTYEIVIKDTCPTNWDMIERAKIDTYRWLDGYTPEAWAQVVFVKNEGFYAHLTCAETRPRAVYSAFYDDVWKDSCLEFFAAYDARSSRYINIEMNANGASLIGIGEGKTERERIDKIIDTPFPVRAEKTDDCWSALVHIPLADLCKIYGLEANAFTDGYRFRGNFYKCGDETDTPHFGMWNPVMHETPNFHLPEYFGEFILKGE